MPSIIRNALALSAIVTAAVAQDGPAPKLDAPCADVVIFMARGNNAPYHDYRTFPFVDATCDKLKKEGKTCDFIEIVFETMHNGDFCTQIGTGVRNGLRQMTDFNKKCPCTHLILNGFSQGAWIAGDILAGPGGCSQITTGLDNTVSPGNAIAAALVWGDVMHVANQPYNVLDGSGLQKDGRSADSLARLNKRYTNVLRSYCQKGDPICANGDNVEKHLNYFELYTDDASSWAVGKVNEAKPLCAAPTPTPSASSSVVPSSVGVAGSVVASSSATPAASGVSTIADPSASAVASSNATPAPSASSAVVASSAIAAASSVSGGSYGAYPVGAAQPSGGAYPVGGAYSGGGAYSPAPASSSTSALPSYPTSPVHVAPFPVPEKYEDDQCLVVMDIEYVYV